MKTETEMYVFNTHLITRAKNTFGPRYFKFFNYKEFPQYMPELQINGKKLDIDGHLVSTLEGCSGLERPDF